MAKFHKDKFLEEVLSPQPSNVLQPASKPTQIQKVSYLLCGSLEHTVLKSSERGHKIYNKGKAEIRVVFLSSSFLRSDYWIIINCTEQLLLTEWSVVCHHHQPARDPESLSQAQNLHRGENISPFYQLSPPAPLFYVRHLRQTSLRMDFTIPIHQQEATEICEVKGVILPSNCFVLVWGFLTTATVKNGLLVFFSGTYQLEIALFYHLQTSAKAE